MHCVNICHSFVLLLCERDIKVTSDGDRNIVKEYNNVVWTTN